MECKNCKTKIPDKSFICPVCNAPQQQGEQFNPNVYENVEQESRGYYYGNNNCYYPPNAFQGYPQNNMQYSMLMQSIDTAKTLGIISLVCAFVLPSIGVIVSIILSAIGLSKINSVPDLPMLLAEKNTARKLNWAGIIISCAIIALIVIIAFIFFAFVLYMEPSF